MFVKCRKFFGKHLGKYKIFRYPYKFFKYLYIEGVTGAVRRANKIIRKNGNSIKDTNMYQNIFVSEAVLKRQSETTFQNEPLISILVPLYNTPEVFLKDMITSVLTQTYENWELILVDAGEKRIFEMLHIDDTRIHYHILDQNYGIVKNTNHAFMLSSGDYVGLLDHDDMLAPQCLFEVVKKINEGADFIYTDEITFKKEPRKDCYQPNLKPDFSPDTLRSYNYICHFSCFAKKLINLDMPLLDIETEGSQDYDLILRLSEKASNIAHIDVPLYFWRAHSASVAENVSAKPYVIDAAKVALRKHLDRLGYIGEVKNGVIPTTYKIEYKIMGTPKVSIIIPNCDHIDDLQKCINSIISKSTYANYEILIVENNSKQTSTFDYYHSVKSDKIKILYYDGVFNYSKINNYAVTFAKGEYIILLNNDIEVITYSWIEELLMFAQRNDVGCVGAKLLYSDNTIQHAGVIIGIGGVAGHAHKYYFKDDYGFMSRLQIAQNLSAVTAACLMIKKALFEEVNGFDKDFAVAFNDVDFCLRVRNLDKLCVYTPFAELYHYESKSRGAEDSPEKIKRFQDEVRLFEKKWGLWQKDPYYNQNLTMKAENFDIE